MALVEQGFVSLFVVVKATAVVVMVTATSFNRFFFLFLYS